MTKRKYSIDEINSVLDHIAQSWSTELDHQIKSDTVYQTIADSNRGKKRTEEQKLNLKLSLTGLKRSDEAKLKFKESAKKRSTTEEGKKHLAKIHQSLKGKGLSSEHKVKVSEALKAYYQSPEGKASKAKAAQLQSQTKLKPENRIKMATFKGKKHTEETKEKIRQAQIQHRAKLRNSSNVTVKEK